MALCCPARRGPAGPAGPPGPPGPALRYLVAGEPIPQGERVIYVDHQGFAYLSDGVEAHTISIVGVTTGIAVPLGGQVPYLPVNGVIEPLSGMLGWYGDCWAGLGGQIVRYQDLPMGVFSRRIGTSVPPRALFLDFGIVVEKT